MSEPSPSRRPGHDDGWVAIVTLLLTTTLLGAIALAVDTASVRSRSAELQRIADASALAGASALPDLSTAQSRAQEAAQRNDPTGRSSVTLSTVPGRPGVVVVQANDSKVSTRFIRRTVSVSRSAYAEQSVGIPMGTPYNSIGTGDLPGTVPGNPTATQGYFLAINGPCTAKEDGDRFMSMFEGTRGSLSGDPNTQNPDAYSCADDSRPGHLWTDGTDAYHVGTAQSQWKRNTDYKPGGYSYIVNVPCDGGVTPCAPGTPISNGVWIDAWDPWFLAWSGEPPCAVATRSTGNDPRCVVDKVPISDPDRNWNQLGLGLNFTKTHFAVYQQNADGTYPTTPMFPVEDFGSIDVKWTYDNPTPGDYPCDWDPKWKDERRNGVPFQAYCKDWFAIHGTPITRAGRYRVQVAADPALAPVQVNAGGFKWDGGRSISMNTYSLRVRRANETPTTWAPCSAETSPTCATITGEGALSVYVRTPGSSDLFLSKMAPAPDYRGRTIQVQLWDPGEGANRIKILEPVPTTVDPTGWRPINFSYSTSDPGLADFTNGTIVQDRAVGWTGSDRTPVPVAAAAGLDVSGTYAVLAPPWPIAQRYSQYKFNGRLLTLDVTVPDDYGKLADGTDATPAQYQGGWWKIRYESNVGVEDRTTWVVTSGSGPVHLARAG